MNRCPRLARLPVELRAGVFAGLEFGERVEQSLIAGLLGHPHVEGDLQIARGAVGNPHPTTPQPQRLAVLTARRQLERHGAPRGSHVDRAAAVLAAAGVRSSASRQSSLPKRELRKKLRAEFNFPKNRDRYFGVPAVYSLENVKYPQADGSVCGTRPAVGPDAALRLDCGTGLGAATHITGAFAFAAAGKALEMLLRPRAS